MSDRRKRPMTFRRAVTLLIALSAAAYAIPTQAQQRCHREGVDVSCDDGHRGAWSRSSPHPSVIIGNKSSVTVGPGVFVGQGKGMVPLDDPNRTRCVTLDEVPYCY